MSTSNLWAVLATFAEELAPVVQDALTAVAAVSNAVVKADTRVLTETQTLSITPSKEKD